MVEDICKKRKLESGTPAAVQSSSELEPTSAKNYVVRTVNNGTVSDHINLCFPIDNISRNTDSTKYNVNKNLVFVNNENCSVKRM